MSGRAAIYTRLSHDPDGTSTATARQRADCEAVAQRLGMEVVRVYEDNDTSAFNKKVRRPEFEAMLSAMKAGDIDAVIVYRSDRLARQPRDLERFIDAAEPHRAQLLSVSEPEFGGASGLMILRMLVNFAAHESAVKGERQQRRNKEAAENGRPWRSGIRRFGRTPDFEPHPVEAQLVREAYDRLLAGESTTGIVRDWRERGVPTVGGGEWRRSNFTRMLRSPAHAGLRSYHDRLLDGDFEAIVSRERWEQAQAVLDARPKPPAPIGRTYMLSGLAVCGRCGNGMTGTSRGRSGRCEYRCCNDKGCGRVSIKLEALDDIVARRFFHVVNTEGFAQLAARQDEEAKDSMAALRRLREDEAALEQLTKDHYVDRTIPRPAFLAAKDALEARISAAKVEVARTASPLLAAAPGDAEALLVEWQRRGPAWRRSVLDAVVRRITVAPATTRGRVLSDRVTVEWLV